MAARGETVTEWINQFTLRGSTPTLDCEVSMRNLIVGLIVAILWTAGSLSAADKINPGFFGTWKLNTAKSKADPGPMVKSQTVKIEPHGDGFMTTVDAENADGTKTHSVRTAALDGKPVPVEGGPQPQAPPKPTRASAIDRFSGSQASTDK